VQKRLRALKVVGPGDRREVRGGVLQVVAVAERGVLLRVLGPGNDKGHVPEYSSVCIHWKLLAPEDDVRHVEGCCR